MPPMAWWAWALGLAVATTRTTNPLVLGLLGAAVVLVVVTCRDDSPWARAFGGYLVLAVVVVVLRVLVHVLVGLRGAGPVVLDLPTVPLPAWAVGVELLGPVTLGGLLGAAYGGLRLAVLLLCFGAANALANPRRALRSLPAALHHLGTAVVIALTVTPQLVDAARDVRRARRLRGESPRGLRGAVDVVVPVLGEALDRSLTLAASMDSRGYARTLTGRGDRRVTALLLTALVAGALGTYGLLDGTSPHWVGLPVLALGATAAVLGGVLAGRQVRRSRYRPERWDVRAVAVAAAGPLAAALLVLTTATDPAALDPSLVPLRVPALPALALGATVLAVLPAALTARPGPRVLPEGAHA